MIHVDDEVQQVQERINIDIPVIDFTGHPDEQRELEMQNWLTEDVKRPFHFHEQSPCLESMCLHRLKMNI